MLAEYGISSLVGDNYAGQTYKAQFGALGYAFTMADKSKSALYEAFEPILNGARVGLLDVPILEQQLLGLIWRGGRIQDPVGEHDDYANAVVGAVVYASRPAMAVQSHVLRMGRRDGGRPMDQRSSRGPVNVTPSDPEAYLTRLRSRFVVLRDF